MVSPRFAKIFAAVMALTARAGSGANARDGRKMCWDEQAIDVCCILNFSWVRGPHPHSDKPEEYTDDPHPGLVFVEGQSADCQTGTTLPPNVQCKMTCGIGFFENTDRNAHAEPAGLQCLDGNERHLTWDEVPVCDPCSNTSYKSDAGPELCTPCPDHTGTNRLGGNSSAECVHCKTGYDGYPTCKGKTCSAEKPVAHANRTCPKGRYGDGLDGDNASTVCVLEGCEDGFEVTGPSSSTAHKFSCDASGRWAGEAACEGVKCSPNLPDEHAVGESGGNHHCEGLRYSESTDGRPNTTCSVSCESGYVPASGRVAQVGYVCGPTIDENGHGQWQPENNGQELVCLKKCAPWTGTPKLLLGPI